MSNISATLSALKRQGKKALVTFVTAGDPSLETSEKIVHKLVESGVDLIELGFPFSDPMADGPVIQKASERALKAGTTLRGVLDLVSSVRRHSNVPIILMGYFNPVLSYGLEAFSRDAASAGVDGLLLVDMPPEEAQEIHPHLKRVGIDLITLLAPTSTPDRCAHLATSGEGFLYYVSMTGVTGTKQVDITPIAPAVKELKKLSQVPVAVGFGISSPEDAKAVAQIADAVVVGSALVKLIAEKTDSPDLLDCIGDYVRQLKKAIIATGV